MEENKDNEVTQLQIKQLHPLLLLNEVKNKFIAIILVAIIAMSCTYIVSYVTYHPQYQTKTTFVVSIRNRASSVSTNYSAANGMASSFSQVLSSDAMKRQIAKDLGVRSINGDISAELVKETNILELSITAATPREAYLITQSFLNNYEHVVETALNNIVLDVLQYPIVPTAPVNPLGIVKPVVLAGVVSILAMVAILCAFAYFRDTVKTMSDAKQELDTKLLGVIPHENKYKTLKSQLKRQKTSILMNNPTTGFDFVETFRKIRTRIDYSMRKNGYKTLAVTSVMEDEGKSTVAANLALAMKKKYKKVLLIDADLKKSALYKVMDYKQFHYSTINEVLDGKADFKDILIEDEASGIYLMLGRDGIENSTELISSEKMKQLITEAKSCMDVVIIDTPPMSVSPDAECLAEIVDATVLVVRQDIAPIKVINDMVDVLNASQATLLGCVLNNYRSADIDDNFSYGVDKGYGKYGYGKYGYGKYGYGKYGYGRSHTTENDEGGV